MGQNIGFLKATLLLAALAALSFPALAKPKPGAKPKPKPGAAATAPKPIEWLDSVKCELRAPIGSLDAEQGTRVTDGELKILDPAPPADPKTPTCRVTYCRSPGLANTFVISHEKTPGAYREERYAVTHAKDQALELSPLTDCPDAESVKKCQARNPENPGACQTIRTIECKGVSTLPTLNRALAGHFQCGGLVKTKPIPFIPIPLAPKRPCPEAAEVKPLSPEKMKAIIDEANSRVPQMSEEEKDAWADFFLEPRTP